LFDKTRKQLVPFLMAGYPSLEASERLALALIEEGVRVLEVGVPFSDPLADGPVIQKVSARALENGVRLKDVFELVSRLRRRSDASIVLFSYLNPLLRYGFENYTRHAVEAGIHATLAVDLPPEEAEAYLAAHEKVGLKTVFLASPTTRPSRLPLIAHASTGFIYYVSRTGVTGEREDLPETLAAQLAPLRDVTSTPIAVGFGISNAEQAAVIARSADAVVIGSRFLSLVEESSDLSEAEKRVRALARNCLAAMNGGIK